MATACFANLTAADVIAISAAAVALCAMVATFLQAGLMRRHNRLSVRPRIDYVVSAYPDKPVTLTIVNNGLGPAIVTRIHINFDGVEYPLQDATMPQEVLDEFIKSDLRIDYNLIGPNTPISAGGNVVLISFNDTAAGPILNNQAVAVLKRFGFTLEYQSMYGETFKLNRASECGKVCQVVPPDARNDGARR